MKILDPQTATLTLPEVQHFLSTRPPPSVPIVPTTNSRATHPLRNHRAILKDISTYVRTLSPHTKDLPPPHIGPDGGWLRAVLRVLGARREDGGYGLTKGECVGVVNLGVGMGVVAAAAEKDVDADDAAEGDGGGEGEEEEEGANSDVQVLHAVVEELETRLTEEEVEELLRRVREIMGEARMVWEREKKGQNQRNTGGDGGSR